ncbi:MAG: phosphonate metabolism protein PhnP [Azoarcus sp.]|jgi:phosphoribosyl 1,2-cyclic phosphate phosphodiesterase|nr:phosphonate metabolism protein PhnP [Azoarcus sp.]
MSAHDTALRLTFLGTGNAAQTPVYGCACPVCARARQETAYRRGPCSALLEIAGQRWLIDSGLPDLAERFPVGSLTGILQTHYHADHAEGLLRLRWGLAPPLPVYGPDDPAGFADLYRHPGPLDFSRPFTAFERRRMTSANRARPMGEEYPVEGEPLASDDTGVFYVTAIPLAHSRPCFGYLIEAAPADSARNVRLAYLTDTVGLPPESETYLKRQRIDLLVLDATFPPQPSAPRNHNDLTRALQTAAVLAPGKTLLTHIGHTLDAWLSSPDAQLPPGVACAKDGAYVEF